MRAPHDTVPLTAQSCTRTQNAPPPNCKHQNSAHTQDTAQVPYIYKKSNSRCLTLARSNKRDTTTEGPQLRLSLPHPQPACHLLNLSTGTGTEVRPKPSQRPTVLTFCHPSHTQLWVVAGRVQSRARRRCLLLQSRSQQNPLSYWLASCSLTPRCYMQLSKKAQT